MQENHNSMSEHTKLTWEWEIMQLIDRSFKPHVHQRLRYVARTYAYAQWQLVKI